MDFNVALIPNYEELVRAELFKQPGRGVIKNKKQETLLKIKNRENVDATNLSKIKIKIKIKIKNKILKEKKQNACRNS